MKKLKLNLGFVSEQLSKEQMKKINGGFGSYCQESCYGYDDSYCNPGDPNNACWTCNQFNDESGVCVH